MRTHRGIIATGLMLFFGTAVGACPAQALHQAMDHAGQETHHAAGHATAAGIHAPGHTHAPHGHATLQAANGRASYRPDDRAAPVAVANFVTPSHGPATRDHRQYVPASRPPHPRDPLSLTSVLRI